jgi:hypothetical protein
MAVRLLHEWPLADADKGDDISGGAATVREKQRRIRAQ